MWAATACLHVQKGDATRNERQPLPAHTRWGRQPASRGKFPPRPSGGRVPPASPCPLDRVTCWCYRRRAAGPAVQRRAGQRRPPVRRPRPEQKERSPAAGGAAGRPDRAVSYVEAQAAPHWRLICFLCATPTGAVNGPHRSWGVRAYGWPAATARGRGGGATTPRSPPHEWVRYRPARCRRSHGGTLAVHRQFLTPPTPLSCTRVSSTLRMGRVCRCVDAVRHQCAQCPRLRRPP